MTGTRTNRTADRALMLGIAGALQVSTRNLKRDPCGDWTITGRRAHLFTDGAQVFAYVPAGSARRWTNVKAALSFMCVTQDGDDEGVLRMQATPTDNQAATMRKVLGLRRVTPLTAGQRQVLASYSFRRDKPPSSAAGIDLLGVTATVAAPTPEAT